MLPKKNRVDKKSFEQILSKGLFVNSPNLTFRFIKKVGSLDPQVSFVVPKAASKKAVTRNLLRRRGYAALGRYMSRFPAGFLGVFFFGKKSVEIFAGRKTKTKNPIAALEHELETILNKIN